MFQLNEIVDPHRVASPTDLEENSNFCVAENTFVDVEKLNDVLRTNKHTKIDEDDDIDEFNIEDCDVDDDDGIKERKRRQF